MENVEVDDWTIHEQEKKKWCEMLKDHVEGVTAELREPMVNLTTTTRKQQPQGLRRVAMSADEPT